jgi:SdpC family antimicrobial peptide
MILQMIHKKASSLYLMLPLCALIFFCTTTASAISTSPKAIDYSAEQLFRGIYFAQGPVADAVPEAKAFDIHRFVKDEEKLQEVLAFQNQLFQEIQRSHPEFLSSFRSTIISGNHYQIKTKLQEGNNYLIEAGETITGVERDPNKEAELRDFLESKIDMESASAEEIAQTIEANEEAEQIVIYYPVIFWPVCLIAFCWVVVYVSMMEMYPDGLFMDQLVDSVANL